MERSGVVGSDGGVVGARDGGAPLAVLLDQRRHDLERLRRAAPALQPQPQHRHPRQPERRRLCSPCPGGQVLALQPAQLLGEDGLVADGDAGVVHPHLVAPAPVRARAQRRARAAGLRDGLVLELDGGVGGVGGGGVGAQRLAVEGRAVGVLAEQHGVGAHADERVARARRRAHHGQRRSKNGLLLIETKKT